MLEFPSLEGQTHSDTSSLGQDDSKVFDKFAELIQQRREAAILYHCILSLDALHIFGYNGSGFLLLLSVNKQCVSSKTVPGL